MCAARLGWADDLNEMFYEANMDEIMHDIMSTVRVIRTLAGIIRTLTGIIRTRRCATSALRCQIGGASETLHWPDGISGSSACARARLRVCACVCGEDGLPEQR